MKTSSISLILKREQALPRTHKSRTNHLVEMMRITRVQVTITLKSQASSAKSILIPTMTSLRWWLATTRVRMLKMTGSINSTLAPSPFTLQTLLMSSLETLPLRYQVWVQLLMEKWKIRLASTQLQGPRSPTSKIRIQEIKNQTLTNMKTTALQAILPSQPRTIKTKTS